MEVINFSILRDSSQYNKLWTNNESIARTAFSVSSKISQRLALFIRIEETGDSFTFFNGVTFSFSNDHDFFIINLSSWLIDLKRKSNINQLPMRTIEFFNRIHDYLSLIWASKHINWAIKNNSCRVLSSFNHFRKLFPLSDCVPTLTSFSHMAVWCSSNHDVHVFEVNHSMVLSGSK